MKRDNIILAGLVVLGLIIAIAFLLRFDFNPPQSSTEFLNNIPEGEWQQSEKGSNTSGEAISKACYSRDQLIELLDYESLFEEYQCPLLGRESDAHFYRVSYELTDQCLSNMPLDDEHKSRLLHGFAEFEILIEGDQYYSAFILDNLYSDNKHSDLESSAIILPFVKQVHMKYLGACHGM